MKVDIGDVIPIMCPNGWYKQDVEVMSVVLYYCTCGVSRKDNGPYNCCIVTNNGIGIRDHEGICYKDYNGWIFNDFNMDSCQEDAGVYELHTRG